MQKLTKRRSWLPPVLFAITVALSFTSASAGQGPKPKPSSSLDGPCWANSQRWVDCGNGTVTDQLTGLIWLAKSDCFNFSVSFAEANQTVRTLKSGTCGLSDNSIQGQWRLPTKAEWEATLLNPAAPCTFPALTNDAGSACWGNGTSSLLNVVSDAYWSSTAKYSVELPNPDDRMRFAWKGNLGVAGIEATLATDTYRIWPVR